MIKNSFDYPIAQPPFEPVPYEDMTKQQAKRHFDWFVSIIPDRLALLRKMYHREVSRQDLDYTFESLIPLWVWMRRHVGRTGVKHIVEIPRPAGAAKGPPVGVESEAFTVTTLALAQDCGMYVAEVLMRVYPFIHWALSKYWHKHSADRAKPVLVGMTSVFEPKGKPEPIEVRPFSLLLKCVIRHLDGDMADDVLLKGASYLRDDAEKSRT